MLVWNVSEQKKYQYEELTGKKLSWIQFAWKIGALSESLKLFCLPTFWKECVVNIGFNIGMAISCFLGISMLAENTAKTALAAAFHFLTNGSPKETSKCESHHHDWSQEVSFSYIVTDQVKLHGQRRAEFWCVIDKVWAGDGGVGVKSCSCALLCEATTATVYILGAATIHVARVVDRRFPEIGMRMLFLENYSWQLKKNTE